MIDARLRIYNRLDGLLVLLVLGISAVAAALVLAGSLAFVPPALLMAWVVARYGKPAYLTVFGCPACQMEMEAGQTCPRCAEMGLVTPCKHDPVKGDQDEDSDEADEQENGDYLHFIPSPLCALHGLMGYKVDLDARFREWEKENPHCRAQRKHAGQILLVDKE